jgi:dihydropteroate synthase
MPREHIHFVTGRLAEEPLRRTAAELAGRLGFEHSVSVLNITVAALMTPAWIAQRLNAPDGTTRIILPGYCSGDLQPVEKVSPGASVERGPKDLRELPEYFGQARPQDYGDYDIEILAEINHAPRLPLGDILVQAEALRRDGADVIDVGCNPGETWAGVAECVKALRDQGHRVSIDSYDPREIEPAVKAGAELVLSVNATNRQYAAGWGCEVVVVPDDPRERELAGLNETVELLSAAGVPFRIDAVLEPIGFGFAESLGRYLEARRRWPEAEMMMGIGNLTELTDADSAAINVMLLAFCQELGIRSVLTTQVINWARSSVRECDLARRLTHYAVKRRALPKHVEPRLVMLRDPRLPRREPQELDRLASDIKDHNYRIFADNGELHLISAGLHLAGQDPFTLFEKLAALEPKNLDPSHAFYLGYEMAKAATALTLGKNYRQDEALDWGFLTRPEASHRQREKRGSGFGVQDSGTANPEPENPDTSIS